MSTPAFVGYTVLGGDLAVVAALLFGLHQALARTGGL